MTRQRIHLDAATSGEVAHVTIRLVPADEVQLGEAMPDGRPPLEIVEHRPGLSLMCHGTERGIAREELRDRARAVAARRGVAYVDPIDPAALALLPPVINAPLLRETLRHILRHPAEWRQSTYRCGTAACFAGHAAILAGGQWLLAEDDESNLAVYVVPTDEEIGQDIAIAVTHADGTRTHATFVADRAQHVLGLTRAQRSRLFATQNDLSQLHVIVSELCAVAEEVAA